MKQKHDMNKVSGYYQGLDGVFYDMKHNVIFDLEYDAMKCFRKGVGIVGNMYVYRTCISKPQNRTIIVEMDYCIRLGEL